MRNSDTIKPVELFLGKTKATYHLTLRGYRGATVRRGSSSAKGGEGQALRGKWKWEVRGSRGG